MSCFAVGKGSVTYGLGADIIIRHFSPSLPVVGQASESLARSCESDLRAEISGESSRYDAQATRPEVRPPIPNFVVRFSSSIQRMRANS